MTFYCEPCSVLFPTTCLGTHTHKHAHRHPRSVSNFISDDSDLGAPDGHGSSSSSSPFFYCYVLFFFFFFFFLFFLFFSWVLIALTRPQRERGEKKKKSVFFFLFSLLLLAPTTTTPYATTICLYLVWRTRFNYLPRVRVMEWGFMNVTRAVYTDASTPRHQSEVSLERFSSCEWANGARLAELNSLSDRCFPFRFFLRFDSAWWFDCFVCFKPTDRTRLSSARTNNTQYKPFCLLRSLFFFFFFFFILF